jgi:hypothetical protein
MLKYSAVLLILVSLCNLRVLCVFVVSFAKGFFTTEAQSPQRLHREIQISALSFDSIVSTSELCSF